MIVKNFFDKKLINPRDLVIKNKNICEIIKNYIKK